MIHVASIKRAGEWDGKAADCVVLAAEDRRRRRIVLTGATGKTCLLDLERPVMLRDGDGLLLDDGSILRVTGAAESLAEVGAPTPLGLLRLAWHLGNRHTDVEIAGDKIRIRRDHVLEEMLQGLGAHVTLLAAPFDPGAGVPSHQNHSGHDHGA